MALRQSRWPIGEHLQAVDAAGIRQNYATLAGYRTVREVAFEGERPDRPAFEDRHRYPEGIRYVLVNGKIAVEEGATTTGCYGRALRG